MNLFNFAFAFMCGLTAVLVLGAFGWPWWVWMAGYSLVGSFGFFAIIALEWKIERE